MRKFIWRVGVAFATILSLYLLIRDWPVYKEIFTKLTTTKAERNIAAFSADINREPLRAANYSYRARVYKEEKKYDEALKDYLKAIELERIYEFYHLDEIANVYLAKADVQRSINYLDRAKKKHPFPEKLLYDQALIYDFQWESAKALKDYAEFLKLNDLRKNQPKLIFTLKRKFVHYLLLSDLPAAQAELENLRKINPDDKMISYYTDLIQKGSNINKDELQTSQKLDVYEAIVVVK